MRRILQIHPSRHCNYTCSHCYSYSSPNSKTFLSVRLLKSAIMDAAALGYTHLSVSGGEPLMYPFLFEILSIAKEQGMSTSLITNGSFTESTYSGLENLLDTIAVSLDGDEPLHNQVRRHPRAFEKVERFLDFINNYIPRVGIAYTLSDASYEVLPSMMACMSNKNIHLLQIHPLESSGRALENPWFQLSIANLKRAFLLVQSIRCQFPFAIQLDITSKAVAEKILRPNMSNRTAADVVDLLVINEEAKALPYTYGMTEDWIIADLQKVRLLEGWEAFHQNHLSAFNAWCQERIHSIEDTLFTPSFVFQSLD